MGREEGGRVGREEGDWQRAIPGEAFSAHAFSPEEPPLKAWNFVCVCVCVCTKHLELRMCTCARTCETNKNLSSVGVMHSSTFPFLI